MSVITDIWNRNLLFRYRRRICRTENRHSDMEVFRYWHQSSIRYPTLKKNIIPPIGFEPGPLAMVSECYNTKLKCLSIKMRMSDIGYWIKLYSNIQTPLSQSGFWVFWGIPEPATVYSLSTLPICHLIHATLVQVASWGGQKTMTSSFNNTVPSSPCCGHCWQSAGWNPLHAGIPSCLVLSSRQQWSGVFTCLVSTPLPFHQLLVDCKVVLNPTGKLQPNTHMVEQQLRTNGKPVATRASYWTQPCTPQPSLHLRTWSPGYREAF